MSIAIKVPELPGAAMGARVGHWYKTVSEVIARNEMLVELHVDDKIIPILAPQAGVVERVFFAQNQIVGSGVVLAYLRTDLPNLVWDEQQDTLVLNTYRADGTASMEYDLRQLIRMGEGKYANGFGTGLALPQIQNPQQNFEQGVEAGVAAASRPQFKSHPHLNTSQFAGDFKDPRVNTVPSNPEAQMAPQNAPTLGANLQMSPSAPTPKPHQ